MGEHQVDQHVDEKKSQAFMKALLEDLRALAFMLQDGRIENGVMRVGAEQEMFLSIVTCDRLCFVVSAGTRKRSATHDRNRPLQSGSQSHAVKLTGDCFSRMEQELDELIDRARDAAAKQDADVLLSGILPTLLKSDLTLDNLTPVARYFELDRGVIRLRGGPLSIHIKGWTSCN